MRMVTIGNATLYQGEALDVLRMLAERAPFAAALVTDPPYSSGGAFRGDRMGDTVRKYVQTGSGSAQRLDGFTGDTRDQRAFVLWSSLWSALALQCAVPGAVCAVFTYWRQLPASSDYLQAGGWVWRGLVPWVKPCARPQPGRFTNAAEYVLWGSHGAMPLDRPVPVLPGFYQCAPPAEREHVAQKPVDLMVDILRIVEAGGTVLDPFMGSGTTGVACARLGLPFVGIEGVPAHYDTACRRIRDAQDAGPLFRGHDQAPLAFGAQAPA